MNILVVDDDGANRKLLRVKLEAEGHRVFEADDGVQALEVLALEPVEGIISDVLMPNMDGYRLCLEVRRNPRLSALPFVIYTSTFTSPGDEHLALKVGTDDYLTKPAPIRPIVDALTRVVAERRPGPSHIVHEQEELLLVREYSDLLVRKLEEKHRDLQLHTERLRQSEERSRLLAAIVESSSDAIISKLLDGTILSWNDGATRLDGYTAEEMIGKSVSILVPPDRLEEWQELVEQAKRGECVSGIETVRVRKDGSRVDVAFKLSPVKDDRGKIVALSTIASDITDQKRAQDELKNSREQLRALAAHLQMVREEERTRMSREIHDELGQMLTGLKMDLRWVENRLVRPLAIGEQQAIQQKIVEAERMADSTIEAIQRIAAELRPSVLDNFGLNAALGFEARRFEQRAGIRVRISAPENLPAVERDVATALFRIFQETLTNAARHAGATKLDVRLYDRGRELVLEVEDNGKGISDDAASRPASLGLLGMSERVGLLGGHISFCGAGGKGTIVTARIPRVKPGESAKG